MKNTESAPNLILLNVGFSSHKANWNWKNVSSPFARIYYIEEGNAEAIINNKTHILKSKHLYLLPPFTLHDTKCDDYFSHYYTHFYEDNLNSEPFFDQYSFPLEIEAKEIDCALMQKLQKLNMDKYLRDYNPKNYDNASTFSQHLARSSQMPFAQRLASEGILYFILSKFIEQAKPKASQQDERISKVMKHIHSNIHCNISISDLAKLAFLSEDHFIRLFKKEISHTPIQYINLKKIEKAQLLLITTNKSVRDIAIELAIDNVSYFNKLFKQNTNMTPSQYRNANLLT